MCTILNTECRGLLRKVNRFRIIFWSVGCLVREEKKISNRYKMITWP
jgi:hypothetical protein